MIDINKIQAVLFDMDGVIVDSEFYWEKKENDFFSGLIPGWSSEDQKKVLGQSIKDLYAMFLTDYKLNLTWEEFSQRYNACAEEIYRKETNLIEGVLELFDRLLFLQKKTALSSASRESWIKIVLERFEIAQYFDEIVSSDFVNEEGKPNPAIYNYTAEKISIPNENCLVIEDSKNGVLAAKNAGMQCIGLRNGFNDNQDLSKADLIVNSFGEIIKMFS